MAGTLTISTLSDGTNSTSSTNCIQGSAKAWVNFNGTSGGLAINASYNVSSVTRSGTGAYTVTFTNAMSDTKYSVTFGAGNSANGVLLCETSRTAGAIVIGGSGPSTARDVESGNLSIFR